MTSLTALRPPPLFPRRSGSFPTPLPPAARARLPFPRLRPRLSPPPLGFCRKKGGGGDAFDLEAEIYQFMERSENPSAFPTRGELVAAGRADLAEAIAREGGWLALGWDLEPEGERRHDAAIYHPASAGDIETESAEDLGGIEGMLKGLETERSLAYGFDSVEEQVNGKASLSDGQGAVLIPSGETVCSSHRSGRLNSSDLSEKLVQNHGSFHSPKRTLEAVSGIGSIPMWRIWSLQGTGYNAIKFEAAEIVMDEERYTGQNFSDDISVDKKVVAWDASKIREAESKCSNTDDGEISRNQLHLRLQQLEFQLSSVLQLVWDRSKSPSSKDRGNELKEIQRLSDELGFKQTEIMNAKNKLQSIQAKLAVHLFKMTHVILQVQKGINVQKKIPYAAQEALSLFRSVHIAWPNSASEVLLAGSFDGWTSQRRMDRLKSGMFTLCLMLYPGRYEIKFIVDGVWMIDPLRPISDSNGYENNVLIVT